MLAEYITVKVEYGYGVFLKRDPFDQWLGNFASMRLAEEYVRLKEAEDKKQQALDTLFEHT